jgi:GWxTD domain-containing protein
MATGRRRGRGHATRWLVLASGLLALAGCAGGRPPFTAPGEPALPLDAYVTTQLDTTGRVEPVVRVTAPYRSLIFRRDGERYAADLRVQVTAIRDGRQAGGGVNTVSVHADTYQETRSVVTLVVEVPVLVRGEGAVRFDVEALVPRTSRTWRRQLDFSPRAAALMPASILAVEVTPPADADGTHVLTAADDSVTVAVRLRATGAPEWPAGGARVALSLTPAGSDAIRRRELPLAPGQAAADTTLRQSWSVASLPFGRASLEVALEARDGTQVERLPFGPTITLLVLRVPLDDDHAWRQHVSWLDGLVPASTVDSLRTLPAAERAAAWAATWERIATQTAEPARAAEVTHLRRIADADARFGGFGRGALTDRGRALIRYGEPERVEQTLDDLSRTGIWEVWHYPSRRLRLIFYDANAINDFRLVEVRQD